MINERKGFIMTEQTEDGIEEVTIVEYENQNSIPIQLKMADGEFLKVEANSKVLLIQTSKGLMPSSMTHEFLEEINRDNEKQFKKEIETKKRKTFLNMFGIKDKLFGKKR